MARTRTGSESSGATDPKARAAVDDALARLCEERDLELVVLFGSRARGEERPDSDSDVGVVGRGGLLRAQERLRLPPLLGRAAGLPNVDLVDLRAAPPLLQHAAGTRGRALYEREPGLFNLFRVRAWQLYLDDERQLRHLDADYIRGALTRLST